MRHQRWVILTYIFTLALVVWQEASSIAVVTRSTNESLRIHDSYIIHFKETATEKHLQRFVDTLVRRNNNSQKFTAEILQQFLPIKCLTARLSAKALSWVIRRKVVVAVKENEYIIVGSDKDSSHNAIAGWHLDRLDQVSLPLDNSSFTANYSGNNVDVYVLDSGINYEHDVFNGRAHYPGCDPVDNEDNEHHQHRAGKDCEGHGTHIAGLIGGKGTGVAIGATLFSVRILDCNLFALESTLVGGLMCVINHRKSRNGTRAIINLAIAGSQTTDAINKALQLALDNDIIIIASAGNGEEFRSINYNSCKIYPAAYPGIINVGAIDESDNLFMGDYDNKTYYTNMGECVDVFAPGYAILSSDLCPPGSSNSCYNRVCRSFRSGTSQSSAIVAGAVALLLEKCPKLTHTEIKNMLRYTLSVKEVKNKKVLTFLSSNLSLHSLVQTVANTRDSLLHLNLSNVNCCNMYHGLRLIKTLNIIYEDS